MHACTSGPRSLVAPEHAFVFDHLAGDTLELFLAPDLRDSLLGEASLDGPAADEDAEWRLHVQGVKHHGLLLVQHLPDGHALRVVHDGFILHLLKAIQGLRPSGGLVHRVGIPHEQRGVHVVGLRHGEELLGAPVLEIGVLAGGADLPLQVLVPVAPVGVLAGPRSPAPSLRAVRSRVLLYADGLVEASQEVAAEVCVEMGCRFWGHATEIQLADSAAPHPVIPVHLLEVHTLAIV
mmetsp:Transcript_60333/g.186785  ORF Transcript_60333/g.186785 Transcript_60333/m.186785 type:complete len:236 (+) Transcript_60333:188-895(+)